MSYSSLPFTSKLFQLTALSISLTLAGCGGGDGTDTIAPTPDLGVEQPGNGDEQTVGAVDIVEGALLNADGSIINSIGLEGAYYKIKVVDDAKTPIINAKVTFDIDAEGISLSQTTSGSVLTDAEGIAQIFLKPDGAEVSGAYTISANVTYEQKTATTETTFSVQVTNVTLSEIIVGSSSLASGGQTPIRLKITNELGSALSGVLINLNSSCGQIPAQVTSDSEGMVEAVFKAIDSDSKLCSGPVGISALTGNKTKSTTITVASAEATSIIYTSNNISLGIANSGSSSSGSVEFTVYSNTVPLANADVILSLENSPLGLSFGELGNKSDLVRKTDENGNVSINIYPGSTPGPVEIKASLARDTRINALSKGISIASSRVTQDGLSISQGKNVLDWSMDGDSTDIVIRMVDRNGNSVPDATVVNLTAEGGKVFPAQCLTTNGECTVRFSAQNPRPGDGRVSILAVAEGEKAYIDNNDNNAWDEGTDTLVHNIGNTFRDDNENSMFDSGEFIYPLTTQASGICDNNLDQFIRLKFPTISTIKKAEYKQNYINTFVNPNITHTCNSGLDAVVRFQTIQLLSDGSDANFTFVNNAGIPLSPQVVSKSANIVNVRTNSGGFYDLNPMPSGTNISVTVTDKTLSNNMSCSVDQLDGFSKVPALVDTGMPGINIGTIGNYVLDSCAAGDYFRVSATAPNGNVTTKTYVIQ
ncbi:MULTISPECIES: hypothetical protein [Psychrobacter]|uniref:hypothetical protein n=1 Tax=Psychrobacter TaxID=497 RepID=UPI000EBBD260|nr:MULTISPECIES: hypothetical protein [Psychrobacter]HCT73339.1 hypothetical protein [Psychrobacter sp.]